MDYGFSSDNLSDNGNQDGGSIFIETSCAEIKWGRFLFVENCAGKKMMTFS